MCWNVFLSRLFSILKLSFYLSLILISNTLGSHANLGFLISKAGSCMFSELICFGAKGFRLISIKDSERLNGILYSDLFLSFLNLLVRSKHELLFFSIIDSSESMLGISSVYWYFIYLCEYDLIVSSNFFLLPSLGKFPKKLVFCFLSSSCLCIKTDFFIVLNTFLITDMFLASLWVS